MQSPYTEDYFLRGPSSGLSNYVNYSWLDEPTMALAKRINEVLDIKPGETFLDFGCARGYLVKAMRRLGVIAEGHDTSEWAIRNCDPEVAEHVSTSLWDHCWEHIWSKDTLEHLEPIELMKTADMMLRTARISILIMVPLTERVGGPYARKEDDMDVTHVVRWPLEEWMNFFQRRILGEEWVLTASWHLPGLKPTSLSHPKSCGFIVMARNQT